MADNVLLITVDSLRRDTLSEFREKAAPNVGSLIRTRCERSEHAL